jgi:hypothetical protein
MFYAACTSSSALGSINTRPQQTGTQQGPCWHPRQRCRHAVPVSSSASTLAGGRVFTPSSLLPPLSLLPCCKPLVCRPQIKQRQGHAVICVARNIYATPRHAMAASPAAPARTGGCSPISTPAQLWNSGSTSAAACFAASSSSPAGMSCSFSACVPAGRRWAVAAGLGREGGRVGEAQGRLPAWRHAAQTTYQVRLQVREGRLQPLPRIGKHHLGLLEHVLLRTAAWLTRGGDLPRGAASAPGGARGEPGRVQITPPPLAAGRAGRRWPP